MYNKKAGILTFHDVRNYGASLQAYALQKKLEESFSSVEIINYNNPKIAQVLRLWAPKNSSIKSLAKAVPALIFRANKKRAFDSFNKNCMNFSREYKRSELTGAGYDVIFAGSDQIWNTDLTDGDESYFLDFPEENVTKVAYAASFGDDTIPDSENISRLINDFDLITVREDNFSDFLRERLTKDYSVVCDPSLLISEKEWAAAASKRLCSSKYAFLFMIDESKELTAIAEKFCKKKGLKLISNKNCKEFFLHPAPNDFLSWIMNAEYVFTNSFHGTVFSMIFRRQFGSFPKNKAGKPKTRITGLLKNTGLTERDLLSPGFDQDKPVDWTSVRSKLDSIADDSWKIISGWLAENIK